MTAEEKVSRLVDVAPGVLKPLNQSELKAVNAELKDIAKAEPAIAEAFAGHPDFRDFLAAALTLSPFFRDIAVTHPTLLVEALTGGLAAHGRADPPDGWGATVFLSLYDPEAFGGLAGFTRQTDWLGDACRQNPPRPGAGPVRMPGD